MASSNQARRVRRLQAVTGLKHQAALRAVVEGREFEVLIQSGYSVGDFVTPREIRTALHITHPSHLRCGEGVHFYPTEQLGQCVGCGMYLEVRYDSEGFEYDHPVTKEEFRAACAEVGLWYEWAPPLAMLNGMSQRDWVVQGRPEHTRTVAEQLDLAISWESPAPCLECGSTNSLIKEDCDTLVPWPAGMEIGDRVCNDCGEVWKPTGSAA